MLDVGCNAGFFAVEAKRRGAARVLGVDAQRHHVRQACFVRRALGLEIEFRRLSVYDLSRPQGVGQFDITLALGLLYHCKHLVQALENLYDVTRDSHHETAIYPPRSRSNGRRYLGLITPMSRVGARHTCWLISRIRGVKRSRLQLVLAEHGEHDGAAKNVGFKEIERALSR